MDSYRSVKSKAKAKRLKCVITPHHFKHKKPKGIKAPYKKPKYKTWLMPC